MKEDEREVLAHIVQTIDEQEIFLEFVAKSEKIKEAWQISKIFDSKKQDFISNIQEYTLAIKDKQKELNDITFQINESNALLSDANKELENLKYKLEEMQSKAKLYKNKIIQATSPQDYDLVLSNLPNELKDNDLLNIKNLLKKFIPLSVVDVHIKNGNTAKARVAQHVYSEELYELYKKACSRLVKMKDRITDLELANSKLEVELRDITVEYDFRENVNSKILNLDMKVVKKDESQTSENKIKKNKNEMEDIFSKLNNDINNVLKNDADAKNE